MSTSDPTKLMIPDIADDTSMLLLLLAFTDRPSAEETRGSKSLIHIYVRFVC
jgi:hypothetical protein